MDTNKLSEELLISYKFHKRSVDQSEFEYYKKWKYCLGNIEIMMYNTNGEDTFEFCGYRIMSVEHLKNIYHAITGSELKPLS